MVYGLYLLIGFCIYWLVFLICILLGFFFFFFPYITIVVNLYSTAHGKNNNLYNFFFVFLLVFVFKAYTNIVLIIKSVLFWYFSVYI
jgi:hypothetical protein